MALQSSTAHTPSQAGGAVVIVSVPYVILGMLQLQFRSVGHVLVAPTLLHGGGICSLLSAWSATLPR